MSVCGSRIEEGLSDDQCGGAARAGGGYGGAIPSGEAEILVAAIPGFLPPPDGYSAGNARLDRGRTHGEREKKEKLKADRIAD